VGTALGELIEISKRLSLPDAVADEAARICRAGLERVRVRRVRLALISASSLYAACRVREAPAALRDVAAASGVDRIELARCYRLLVNELELRVPVAGPTECLARVASRAKVSEKVEAEAREILSRAEKAGITDGLHPGGLAASALYLASLLEGEWLTESSAALAASVEEATVRNEYRRLRKVLSVSLGRAPRTKRRSSSQSEVRSALEVRARSIA